MSIYTVQMHDGHSWSSFGVRMDPDKRVPIACSAAYAATGSKEEMEQLKEFASRVTGGTMRVAKVNA